MENKRFKIGEWDVEVHKDPKQSGKFPWVWTAKTDEIDKESEESFETSDEAEFNARANLES
jgi:hypothetical protein